MPHPKTPEPADDLPAGLGQPALRALNAAGITQLTQLTRLTEAELLALHGVGPKAARLLQAALKAQGLALAAPASTGKTGSEAVSNSPKSWVKTHIEGYLASDGQRGHQWRGWPTLLLTVRGRKSGQLRRTALIYGRAGQNYLVVASNGGAARHPLWYLNLLDDPAVQVQVGAETFKARARTAPPEEKPRLWQIMRTIYPAYDSYQAKTDRDIPLVILEPVP